MSFLIETTPYLHFILKLVEIQTDMQSRGLKLCKPIFYPKEDKVFRAKNLYNPVLALKLANSGSAVIKNDFSFDENGMIYLLQGPNNGGKTVFLTSICICQIFAQLGMLTPASHLEISPADGIFIHFQNYKTLNENGRLADECVKISEMFKNITEYSICFFDEAFSSTDASGSVELSKNVLESLSYMKVRTVFNTHNHELTACADKINSSSLGVKIDFITAQIMEDERRTYHMERQRSENTSYAQTIARRLGITFKDLTRSDR